MCEVVNITPQFSLPIQFPGTHFRQFILSKTTLLIPILSYHDGRSSWRHMAKWWSPLRPLSQQAVLCRSHGSLARSRWNEVGMFASHYGTVNLKRAYLLHTTTYNTIVHICFILQHYRACLLHTSTLSCMFSSHFNTIGHVYFTLQHYLCRQCDLLALPQQSL